MSESDLPIITLNDLLANLLLRQWLGRIDRSLKGVTAYREHEAVRHRMVLSLLSIGIRVAISR